MKFKVQQARLQQLYCCSCQVWRWIFILSSSCPPQVNSRKRLAKTVLVFVGLFAVCWLPSHVIYLYRSFHYDQVDTSVGHFIASVCARILAFTNSCVNPFALYLMSKNFSKHFRQQLLCCSSPQRLYSQRSRDTNVTSVWNVKEALLVCPSLQIQNQEFSFAVTGSCQVVILFIILVFLYFRMSVLQGLVQQMSNHGLGFNQAQKPLAIMHPCKMNVWSYSLGTQSLFLCTCFC